MTHIAFRPRGEDVELVLDYVVVGSGAGGATAAVTLARGGEKVAIVEAGPWRDPEDYPHSTYGTMRDMMDDWGSTITVGRAFWPVVQAKLVGGTTVINSGTCYRMPERVYKEWHERHGLFAYTPDSLAEHYERVEQALGVTQAASHLLGAGAQAMARGCDALGYKHAPLRRNAPDCDGQGVCCFGCPTDAKRSTNVSFVPMALQAGASLVTGARAQRLLIEGGRVVGVTAAALPHGSGRSFTVRARAVIVESA